MHVSFPFLSIDSCIPFEQPAPIDAPQDKDAFNTGMLFFHHLYDCECFFV